MEKKSVRLFQPAKETFTSNGIGTYDHCFSRTLLYLLSYWAPDNRWSSNVNLSSSWISNPVNIGENNSDSAKAQNMLGICTWIISQGITASRENPPGRYSQQRKFSYLEWDSNPLLYQFVRQNEMLYQLSCWSSTVGWIRIEVLPGCSNLDINAGTTCP